MESELHSAAIDTGTYEKESTEILINTADEETSTSSHVSL